MSFTDWPLPIRRWIASKPSPLRDAGLAFTLVTLGSVIAYFLYSPLGEMRLAMILLLPVLFAGLLGGLRAALIAAASAYFVYNFFLVDPPFTLKIVRADDAVTLVVFVVAAFIAGVGPGLLREEQRKAAARSQMMLTIIESNDFFTVTPSEDAIRQRLAESVSSMTKTGAIVTDREGHLSHRAGDGTRWKGGLDGELEHLARTAIGQVRKHTVARGSFRARSARLHAVTLGAVIWLPPEGDSSVIREAEEHVGLLADLASAAIVRFRRDQQRHQM